jgi:hypothetical protein
MRLMISILMMVIIVGCAEVDHVPDQPPPLPDDDPVVEDEETGIDDVFEESDEISPPQIPT